MQRRNRRAWLLAPMAVVGAVAAVALAVAFPAWAADSININPGNVPTTAAGYGTHSCDPNQGGGPFAGQDVWVFVLPGQHSTSGDFVSVTADFGTNGTKTITAASNPSNFSNGGPATSKAWIVTPAGWTLVGATADITGTADFFNLTHTCPSSTSPSPTPSPSRSTGQSPSPSASSSSSASSSASASTSTSTTSSGSPTTPGGGSPGTIPSGGVSTGGGGSQRHGSLGWGIAALVAATGGGVGLVMARRRRNNA